MSATSPVRYPDQSSPQVMRKRAWWLVVLNLLIPGSAQVLAGNRRLGRFGVGATFVLWALVILVVIGYLLVPATVITILTNPIVLWILQAAIIFYLALWFILTFDALRLVRIVLVPSSVRPFVAGFAVVALVATVGVGAYGVMIAGVTRGTIQDVFSGGDIAEPVNGRYNILLLGGDAGPDRDGLRPDSITVVSIEAETGAVTTFGVPRNLELVPFSAGSPMLQLYPNGYGVDGCDVDVCLINSIYTEVMAYDQALYPDAEANGSSPGIEAMRDAVEGALGMTIQYYVLIDMQGFSQLIDALGGITINSPGRYPINGDEEGNGIEGWIEPGVQQMNGYTALWYARSRYGTTDYDRMQRQRQVMEAILQQFEPANVLTKFQAVAQAGAQVVRTDIPQPMLGLFVQLAQKARELPIDKIELVPPLIAVDDGDFEYIHQLVAEALVIPTPEPE